MTEIVQNNNSMKFDLLETSNGSASLTESGGIFNSLFGNMEVKSGNEIEMENFSEREDVNDNGTIFDVINLLKNSELNLNKDILNEIEKRLTKLFETIKINIETQASVNLEQETSSGNENFVHLMKFLEDLRGLIYTNENNQNVGKELDLLLDKVRKKLNEQIKSTLASKTSVRISGKSDANIKVHNKTDSTGSNEQSYNVKDIPSSIDRNPRELEIIQSKKNNPSLNDKVYKKTSLKPKSLNGAQQQENRISQFTNSATNPTEKNMDPQNQNSANSLFLKELYPEVSSSRNTIALTNKIEMASNLDPSNVQKHSMSSQQNNDKFVQTLNMLSKTWGNKLIEKIEKSLVDGIEQLEIALTPKSLGRLNVTINLNDTVAKINIIAESAGAAALLGEAEHRLSQMMESSGLKLASLQTLTQQFGSNQKGKDQDHKLASLAKKSSIKDSSSLPETTNKKDIESDGLNLIA